MYCTFSRFVTQRHTDVGVVAMATDHLVVLSGLPLPLVDGLTAKTLRTYCCKVWALLSLWWLNLSCFGR